MESSTCYCAALRKATRRLTAAYDAALAPVGVNLAQFSLLRTVSRHGPLSLTDLARRMELDRSTVGRNVKVVAAARAAAARRQRRPARGGDRARAGRPAHRSPRRCRSGPGPDRDRGRLGPTRSDALLAELGGIGGLTRAPIKWSPRPSPGTAPD